jgi:hypothetical protein
MRVVLAAVWVAALGTACGSRLTHPSYTEQPPTALEEVQLPPPPARVETVPARPAPAAVWVDGEWIWRRARWAWLPGRWVIPPQGAAFAPWVFVRGADGRLWYAHGRWRDAAGAPVPAPEALARATVEGGAIVDAEGKIAPTGPILMDRPSGP